MTNHASPLPWNVRSRALVFPLPASVTPRQLRALLAAQIGFVHDFTQHQVAENTWMAEVTFENNVAKNAVDEFNGAILDQTTKIQVVAIYRGARITPDELRQVALSRSLEPLRAKHFIAPYIPGARTEREKWGSRISGQDAEKLRYTLDEDLATYRDGDDRMDLDRYGN